MPSYLILRIRGRVDVRKDISETLNRLNLNRKFHATVVPDDDVYKGMIFKVKDYVAFGPADPETVKEMLLARGRFLGNKPVTPEGIKEITGLDIDEVAEKLADGSMRLKDIRGLKPIFRLSPPRGGFKGSIKKHATVGGELGYRDDISSLIKKML